MKSAAKGIAGSALMAVLTAMVLGLMLGAPSPALAVNEFCDVVSGAVGTGECLVNSVHNPASGPFTIDRNLHITGTGALVTGAAGIAITITPAGDFLMDSGALIDGNVAGCNTSGPITVTLADGDVDLATGSIIRSNSCSGGAIQITTTASHTANIDGTVESVGTISGVGNPQPPGGGTITIIAGCALTVSDTGKVSSRGQDPGADLVHLEGCVVTINGLVESTGNGHVNPNSPANHCNLEPAAHPPASPPSSFFTGCVEIWSGTTVTINSVPPHKGEVNADVGFTGGSQGRGWIDIYANGAINIIDGTGNDHQAPIPPNGPATYFTSFAVHSNGGILQNTDDGGLITIKSLAGDVFASGNAIQADAIASGSNGGEVHVEANNNVNFNNATLFARGDFNSGGGFGTGGKLGTVGAPIRAFTGALTWTTGTGNVRPTGTLVPVAQRGQINLEACTALTLGAAFPVDGAAVPPFPTTTGPGAAFCGGSPTKATLGALPVATCFVDFCGGTQSKSGMKFFDANQNHKNDGLPTEPGLANWTIKAFDSFTDVLAGSATTDATGNYNIPLNPGTYKVCEVQQAGFTQTCPQGSPLNLDCNLNPTATVDDCSTILGGGVSGVGYLITIVANQNDTGNDFGNFKPTECREDPTAVLTRSVSNPGSGVPNYDTVQAAYDAAADTGETIGLFGITSENVNLGGAKTLKITQCTSARITAKDIGLPVWKITSTGKLTIQGPDSVGGTIGWWLVTPNHTLKSVRANGASQYGILVDSNGNSVSWNNVSGNGPGAGIRVNGGSNILKGGTVGPNSGDGVQLVGNTNTLSGATVQSNTANGVLVQGSSNAIKSNKANLNTGDGFNNAAGAGNKYSGNSSNTGGKENGGAEYRFVTTGDNGGSNRADGVNVPSAAKGCISFNAGQVCE